MHQACQATIARMSPTLALVVLAVAVARALIGRRVVVDSAVREANLIRSIDVQKRSANRNPVTRHIEMTVPAVQPLAHVFAVFAAHRVQLLFTRRHAGMAGIALH